MAKHDTQHDGIMTFSTMILNKIKKHNGTRHNDTQHNDTQQHDTQHNDTQHDEAQQHDTQHNETHNDTQHTSMECRLMSVSFFLIFCSVSLC